MHGSIFFELERYADGRFGEGTFYKLLDAAGLSDRAYDPTLVYPDAEAVALVHAASVALGQSETQVLEEFGRFLGPELLRLYWALIEPSWHTLDVLENTETAIHRVVRVRDASATPPELRVERPNPREIIVHYTSPRRLCALARGLIEGIADYYVEDISIVETQCMHRGDAECCIHVRKKITGALPSV